MDLNNWIRKDGDYLGFTSPGTPTDVNKWAIVKASTNFRDWADNDTMMDKIWDDRTSYFSVPSVAPSLVSSASTEHTIDVTWDYVAGMTKYYVTVKNENNREMLGWIGKRIELTPNKQIIVRIHHLASKTTYKVILKGLNGKGEIITEENITTK